MASFDVLITARDYSSVVLNGIFVGGDPAYQNYRQIALVFRHGGSVVPPLPIQSEESSGPDNTFYAVIHGFESGETYTWQATLQYYDAAGWHDSSYTDSGSFTMPDTPPPAPDVQAWIYSGGWKRAQAWIYSGGWKRAQAWIYNGRWR